MIYEPAEDSYLLEEEVKKLAEGKDVLDIGTGSGIILEAVLSVGAKSARGVDINQECVEFCKKKGLDVIQSNLFENVSGKFDLIIFNPPYLPGDENEDGESREITSGGVEGDEIIIKFLSEAGDYLTKNGEILLLVSSLTPLDRIEKVLKEKKFVRKFAASEKIFMEILEVWKLSRK